MSYCRFSTDDFQCDVYVYESEDGLVTRVARNRIIYIDPLPPRIELTSETATEWFDRYEQVVAIMERSERRAIGLPHDGDDFLDDDAEACAERLEYLKVTGYIVPQKAIDALREEAEEEKKGAVTG